MSLEAAVPAYQRASMGRAPEEDSDAEEDALVNDYKEQVQYDTSMDDMSHVGSLGGSGNVDIAGQLQQAATPLDYQATLETKLHSYDNYCSLFHFILNSEGPVDLEVPTVSRQHSNCHAV
jgi:translation initiation factor 3 subunit L